MSTAQEVVESTTTTEQTSQITPSPLPIRTKPQNDGEVASDSSRPHPKPKQPTPTLRFQCHDLSHAGAAIFFKHANLTTIISDAVAQVLEVLYSPSDMATNIPPVRSVTLVLRPMGGVAYTTGLDLDDDHKEIHFNLHYIASKLNDTPERQRDEIVGVIVHEMVHVWQWNACGTAPGGLIEGIADFVRLKAGLSPPHWKKEAGGKWDNGYQHTGYFLEWIENTYGKGKVSEINMALMNTKYDEEKLWNDVVGHSVKHLWKKYSREVNGEDVKDGEELNENKASS